jgi:excisionase family DNA binding protein
LQTEYLTVAEVAERLRVNQQTIRNWIDRGELRAVRVGARRVRVRVEDLDEFVGVTHQASPQPAGSHTVPGMNSTPPAAPGARFDSVKIAQASESAADIEELARLTGYSLDDRRSFRRRVSRMVRDGQIDSKFARRVAPGRRTPDVAALDPREMESLREFAETMLLWSARSPKESPMAGELAGLPAA